MEGSLFTGATAGSALGATKLNMEPPAADAGAAARAEPNDLDSFPPNNEVGGLVSARLDGKPPKSEVCAAGCTCAVKEGEGAAGERNPLEALFSAGAEAGAPKRLVLGGRGDADGDLLKRAEFAKKFGMLGVASDVFDAVSGVGGMRENAGVGAAGVAGAVMGNENADFAGVGGAGVERGALAGCCVGLTVVKENGRAAIGGSLASLIAGAGVGAA